MTTNEHPADALLDPAYRAQIQALNDTTRALSGLPPVPVVFSTDSNSVLRAGKVDRSETFCAAVVRAAGYVIRPRCSTVNEGHPGALMLVDPHDDEGGYRIVGDSKEELAQVAFKHLGLGQLDKGSVIGVGATTPDRNDSELQPGAWGTKDGLPAIEWWRHGVAAKGEPSVVTVVITYPTEAERLETFAAERKL